MSHEWGTRDHLAGSLDMLARAASRTIWGIPVSYVQSSTGEEDNTLRDNGDNESRTRDASKGKLASEEVFQRIVRTSKAPAQLVIRKCLGGLVSLTEEMTRHWD